ncbi:hypothetical protein VTK73DRAFT_7211 [Phialemonium thermophilum]|uniref:Uncharacterized protein n=1 Tax=Phialemonium thermophilum TaxID=223376 RepID=A0ABR3WFM7_9PEZI
MASSILKSLVALSLVFATHSASATAIPQHENVPSRHHNRADTGAEPLAFPLADRTGDSALAGAKLSRRYNDPEDSLYGYGESKPHLDACESHSGGHPSPQRKFSDEYTFFSTPLTPLTPHETGTRSPMPTLSSTYPPSPSSNNTSFSIPTVSLLPPGPLAMELAATGSVSPVAPTAPLPRPAEQLPGFVLPPGFVPQPPLAAPPQTAAAAPPALATPFGFAVPPAFAPGPGFALPPNYNPPPGFALPPSFTLPPGWVVPPGLVPVPGFALPPGFQVPPGVPLQLGFRLQPGASMPSGNPVAFATPSGGFSLQAGLGRPLVTVQTESITAAGIPAPTSSAPPTFLPSQSGTAGVQSSPTLCTFTRPIVPLAMANLDGTSTSFIFTQTVTTTLTFPCPSTCAKSAVLETRIVAGQGPVLHPASATTTLFTTSTVTAAECSRTADRLSLDETEASQDSDGEEDNN